MNLVVLQFDWVEILTTTKFVILTKVVQFTMMNCSMIKYKNDVLHAKIVQHTRKKKPIFTDDS